MTGASFWHVYCIHLLSSGAHDTATGSPTHEFCLNNWSRAMSPPSKEARLSSGLCMTIAAAGPLQSLIVVDPPTVPIARMTSPRAQDRLLVNHDPSECQTTNIWSLLIQYFSLNSFTIASKRAKSLNLDDGSPGLLHVRGDVSSGRPLG